MRYAFRNVALVIPLLLLVLAAPPGAEAGPDFNQAVTTSSVTVNFGGCYPNVVVLNDDDSSNGLHYRLFAENETAAPATTANRYLKPKQGRKYGFEGRARPCYHAATAVTASGTATLRIEVHDVDVEVIGARGGGGGEGDVTEAGNNDLTGTNTVVAGTSLGLKDPTDPTKIGQLDLSNIPTATTRTYALPGGGGTIPAVTGNGYPVKTSDGAATARAFVAGVGQVCVNGDGVAGNTTCGPDQTVVVFKASGTSSAASVPCGDTGDPIQLGDFYYETDAQVLSMCRGVDLYVTLAGASGGYATIQDEGSGVTQRVTLNFIGSAVSCVDNSGSSRTDCTFTGGGVDYATTFSYWEDFLGGLATTGNIGQNGNAFTAISGGQVACCTTSGGTEAIPGWFRIIAASSATDNSGALVYPIANAQTDSTFWNNTEWAVDIHLKPLLVTNMAVYAGISTANNAEPVGGSVSGLIAARFDTDHSDTTWKFVVCDSNTGCAAAGDGTDTRVADSTITPTAGGKNRIRISRCATCSPGSGPMISFRVNNETPVTFCASGCTETLAELQTATDKSMTVIGVTRTATSSVDLVEIDAYGLTATIARQ